MASELDWQRYRLDELRVSFPREPTTINMPRGVRVELEDPEWRLEAEVESFSSVAEALVELGFDYRAQMELKGYEGFSEIAESFQDGGREVVADRGGVRTRIFEFRSGSDVYRLQAMSASKAGDEVSNAFLRSISILEPGPRMADAAVPSAPSAGNVDRSRARRQSVKELADKAMLSAAPLAIGVAGNLIPFVTATSALNPACEAAAKEMRERVRRDLGAPVPAFRFRQESIPPGTYIVFLNDIPTVSGNVDPAKRFVPSSGEELQRRNLRATKASPMIEGSWIAEVDAAAVSAWEVIEYPIRHAEIVVRQNLALCVGHDIVRGLLREESGEASAWILGSGDRLTVFVHVIRTLLDEQTTIAPLGALATRFKELHEGGAGRESSIAELRAIPEVRRRLIGNQAHDRLLTVSPSLEASLLAALAPHGDVRLLTLQPEVTQSILEKVRKAATGVRGAVVVADRLLRPYLRQLVRLEFVDLFAIASEELLEGWQRRVVGKVEG